MIAGLDRRARVMLVVEDLVTSLLWEDRKGDEDLPRGEIEAAIAAGEITADDVVGVFHCALRRGLER